MTSRMGISAASRLDMHAAINGKSRFIMFISECPLAPGSFQALFTHDFNNDAFRPAPVEFGVINLLPGPEIELSGGHWNDHLVMHQKAFQVRIAIGLAG